MTCLNNLGYFWPKLTLYNELRGNVDKNKYQLAIGGGYMGDEFLSVENLYWDGANAFAGYNTEMAQESFGGQSSQAGGGNASNAGAATFGAYDVYTETRWLNGYYEEECRKRELCGAFIWDKTRQRVFYIKYNKLIIGGKGNQYRGRRLAYTESYVKQLRHDVPLKLGRELKTLRAKDLTETTYGPNFHIKIFR